MSLSTMRGRRPFIASLKKQKHKKKKQKLGFPIKDFGNDERGGVTPEWFYCPYSSPRQFLSRGPNYKGDKSPL